MSDTLDRRLADVLALHFDPRTGSPYWLERQRQLGFDVRREVRRVDDLPLLGPTAPADLTTRPLEDFVPRRLLERKGEWVVAETGGTLGRPTITLWLRRELAAAFVDPFTAVATACRFPVGAGWLFVGPTGPHVIGRAMRGNARALGSAEPFTVDFDPRWAKKLPAGSLAARRYLDHVVEQALAILEVQEVGVLFSTPPVLLALAAALPAARRERIGGVFYAGMALEPEAAAELLGSFPRAVHLAGYGNSLVGLALELAPSTDGHHDYFYPLGRVALRLVPRGDEPAAERLAREVAPGEVGQVVVSRLDDSFFLPNLFERDEAVRLPVPAKAPWPVLSPGLRDPTPLSTGRPVAQGLY